MLNCMQYNALHQGSWLIAHFNNKGYFSIHKSLQKLGFHSFLLSLYFVFKLRLILCVNMLNMHVSVDYVACKWRYPPFVTLILNK